MAENGFLLDNQTTDSFHICQISCYMSDLKYNVSLNFFLATWIEKLPIDPDRGPRLARSICVFRRSYLFCIDVLIKRDTCLIISIT